MQKKPKNKSTKRLKEYETGLLEGCKERPEDVYRWDETVQKYENEDLN